MKIFLVYLAAAFLSVVIQAKLFAGIKPDIVLVLVCFYSIRDRGIKGMAFGALTGMIIDSASGFILGPNMLSKAIAGYLSASIREKFFDWNFLLNTALVLILSALDNLLIYICFSQFAGISFAERSWMPSILQVVYTTLAGIILYPVIKMATEKWEMKNG
ncbi:MAG: rod shape-determining protein MreD [Nitrospirae bacterium]|nr:rod shape-determining protein MreD [Nitrospirota bacterium]